MCTSSDCPLNLLVEIINPMERLKLLLSHRFSTKFLKADYEAINRLGLENESIRSLTQDVEFVSRANHQYLTTFIVSLGGFSYGLSVGWAAPALPNMENSDNFPGFDSESNVATWISAISFIGSFCSCFIMGFLIQRFGRKWTMVIHGPIFTVGWLIIAFAPALSWIMVGRFVTGFASAAITLAIVVYMGEISEARIRGMLCNSIGFAVGLGILVAYVMGSLISWRHLSLISGMMPTAFTVGVLYIPESPYFLISHGKIEETLEALKWLRGATRDEQIINEFISKKNSVHYRKQAKWTGVFSPSVLKPFTICLMLVIFQQFGGIKAVLFYSVDMFSYAGAGINPNIAAIIVAGSQVIVLAASTQAVERWGRRISIMVSEVGMAASLTALGIFFYMKEHNEDVQLEWLPLTSLIGYVISFNMGVGPVTWTIVGEILPSNSKGLTSGIIAGFSHALAFSITKFFLQMENLFTSYGCYWFFAAMSFAGFLFCLFVIPETKGKKLQDIQAFFAKH